MDARELDDSSTETDGVDRWSPRRPLTDAREAWEDPTAEEEIDSRTEWIVPQDFAPEDAKDMSATVAVPVRHRAAHD
jgi:hypothetical protein